MDKNVYDVSIGRDLLGLPLRFPVCTIQSSVIMIDIPKLTSISLDV